MLLASQLSISQKSDIRGFVSDSATGEKIPYANVVLLQTRYGASANLSGFYLVAAIPADTYQLSASAIGFQTKRKTITVSAGESIRLDISLIEEAVRMQEVTVTERAGRTLTEVQTSVQVLDPHDLKLVPITVQDDVFRSIQILPGIVSTSDVTTQFYVRGGAGDQNLIMLDGMRIYSPYHALGILSIVDTDVLQNSTVYTGAFPAGFGGRLSSVVSLTSRDGRNTSPVIKTSVNLLSAKLAAEGPIGEHLRILANGRKSISAAPMTRFFNRSVPIEFYDFYAKATLERSGGSTKYSAVTFLSGDNLRSSQQNEADYSWKNAVLGFGGSGLIADRLFVNSVLYASHFEARRDPKLSSLLPANSTVADLTFRTDGTLYSDSGTLYLLGFEFSFPSFNYHLVNNLGRSVRLQQTVADVSAWMRANITFGSWACDGGVHIDATSLLLGRSGYWLQPRVSASMALSEVWRLKVAYGRFTQSEVTVNNEDDLISLFDAWIAVPENINVERADHVVVAVTGSLFSHVGLDVQTYFKKYGALVSYNPDKLVPTDPDYVSGSGQSYGSEVLLRYEHSATDILVSYSLSSTLLFNRGLTYHPRYDRRHSVKSLAVYHAFAGLDIAARWDYGSGLPFTPSLAYYNRLTYGDVFRAPRFFESGVPYVALGDKNSANLLPFHRLDLSATYHLELDPFALGVALSVLNVYNRKNIFYFDRRSGRRVNSLSLFPSFQLTLEYR